MIWVFSRYLAHWNSRTHSKQHLLSWKNKRHVRLVESTLNFKNVRDLIFTCMIWTKRTIWTDTAFIIGQSRKVKWYKMAWNNWCTMLTTKPNKKNPFPTVLFLRYCKYSLGTILMYTWFQCLFCICIVNSFKRKKMGESGLEPTRLKSGIQTLGSNSLQSILSCVTQACLL